MKIAILSDIHANAHALTAVLEAISKYSIEAVLVAGDLIGYYFQPKKTIDMLRALPIPVYCVKGNHEEMLISAHNCSESLALITNKYGPGISIALQELTNSDIEWICNLGHPMQINDLNCSIVLSHGSPDDMNRYVYPDHSVNPVSYYNYTNAPDVLIMGHTHYPMIKKFGRTIIINPGSVGQPRDRRSGAHWVLLDTHTMIATHRIEKYNVGIVVQQCKEKAPKHPYLCEVLQRI